MPASAFPDPPGAEVQDKAPTDRVITMKMNKARKMTGSTADEVEQDVVVEQRLKALAEHLTHLPLPRPVGARCAVSRGSSPHP